MFSIYTATKLIYPKYLAPYKINSYRKCIKLPKCQMPKIPQNASNVKLQNRTKINRTFSAWLTDHCYVIGLPLTITGLRKNFKSGAPHWVGFCKPWIHPLGGSCRLTLTPTGNHECLISTTFENIHQTTLISMYIDALVTPPLLSTKKYSWKF